MRISSLSLSLVALPLIACTGGERATSGTCPAGEVCSPATPHGVHFVGAAMSDALFGSALGPAATAIGGTQDIDLEIERADGSLIPLTLPYAVDDDGGSGVAVDHTAGAIVTVRGAGSRTNYLRVVDPADGSLYDRYQLTGAALDRIELVGTQLESVPADAKLVWAPGDQRIGIALLGAVQQASGPVDARLVDTSMQLSLAGAQRTAWDELRLPNATVGVHALAVTAGNKPAANVELEIVDHADQIALQGAQPASVRAGSSDLFCFSALSNDRYIYGLTWTFDVDGTVTTKDISSVMRNCVSVTATAGRTAPIPVTVHAGGRAISLSVAIGAAALAPTVTAPAHTGLVRTQSTAGDRAAM